MDSLMLYSVSVAFLVVTISIVACLWWAFSHKRQTARDIIENVNETIVIFDSSDKACYVNLTLSKGEIDEFEFLQSIEREINQSTDVPRDLNTRCIEEKEPLLFEGEMKPLTNREIVLSWKMCPVVKNRQYMGRIYVFNDITQYVTLQRQLDHQNNKLKAALESQRRFALISQKLSAEEERERIMVIINNMAKEYLGKLYNGISEMENSTYEVNADPSERFEEENEKMIQLTRETIRDVRKTVKELHAIV